MDRYSDGWKELNAALQLVQKKLLKRPNYAEALNKLREVSAHMLDLEMFEHAAICHKEMANIYLKTNNSIAERENNLKAADLYSKAYKRYKSLCSTVDSHLLTEMESCYLLALENCSTNNCTYLSGTILLELAFHLMEFENFELAFEYLQKASHFLQSDFYQQKIILDNMCQCVRRVENFDEALYDTTLIFNNLTKTETFMSPIREKLVGVELKLILLHLGQFIADGQQRPKSLLAAYSTGLVRPNLMSRDELQSTTLLIEAFKKRDILKIHSIFHKDLFHLIDDFCKKLTTELITKISSSTTTTTQKEFQDILDDKSIDELERRKQMFEWYQSAARKNKLTFETL